MKASLIIIFYNSARYLEPCLASVLSQVVPYDEIILVNDGSTDNSLEIAESYLPCHPALRIVSHERNLGRAAARETGWKTSTGDIVVYMDSDARCGPRILEQLLRLYQTYPDAGGIAGRGVETCRESLADRYRCAHYGLDLGDVERAVPYVYGIYMSFPRTVLEGLAPHDLANSLENDSDLSIRVVQSGRELIYSPTLLVYHMRHDSWKSLFRMAYHYFYAHRAAELRRGVIKPGLTLQVLRSSYAFLRSLGAVLDIPRMPVRALRPLVCAYEGYALVRAEIDFRRH